MVAISKTRHLRMSEALVGDHPDPGPLRPFAELPGKIQMIGASLASGLPGSPP